MSNNGGYEYHEAFPGPSDEPQAEASEELDFSTINKIDRIFHGLTDHGDPMLRMGQAREVMAEHDAQLIASHSASNAEKALRDAFESGYSQGHNDTVENCIRDMRDAASDYLATPENKK